MQKYAFLLLLMVLMSFSGCKTTEYSSAVLVGASGHFATDLKALPQEVKTFTPLAVKDYSRLAFLQIETNDDKDNLRTLLKNTAQIGKIYEAEEFSQFLIENKTLKGISISDLVGLNQIQQQLGNFLYVKITYFTARYNQLSIQVFDPSTGKKVFEVERFSTNNSFEDLNKILFFPCFNSLIDWFEAGKKSEK